MKTKVIVVGAAGRMGQAIIRLASSSEDVEIVAGIDQGDRLEDVITRGEAVIDFSHHSVTLAVARLCAEHGKALAIGTTGHSAALRDEVLALGSRVPMIFSSNYSVGVNTLFFLTRKAAEILRGYDQEIIEMHHRHKKDAPSGTARSLGEILCAVKGRPYDELVRDGRSGEPGPRTADEIGMHALRGGDVVGDHTVVFATEGERVELTHKASSRDTFAKGALRAARWLVGRPPGVYTMAQVLGLEG
jgi:4-hydroxy-tetrahydrodipicolinate reductase